MEYTRRDALRFAAFAASLGVAGGLCRTKKVPNLTTTKRARKRVTSDFPYRLGKQPARNTVRLRLRDYLPNRHLPAVPDDFGHELLVGDWGVLGNDEWGDCAIAGPYHSLQLWNAEGAKNFDVETATVLGSYSAVTGFDINAGPPGENPTDGGTNIEDMAEYWRTDGFKDDDGNVHKIDAYVALEPGDVQQLWAAAYLFDGLGVGLNFPQEWMSAFSAGQTWDKLDKYTIAGGHYVTGVARRHGNLVAVTWGRLQQITAAGYEQFNDETLIYLDEDKLIQGKDINGFNIDQLRDDMWQLSQCETKISADESAEESWESDGGALEEAA